MGKIEQVSLFRKARNKCLPLQGRPNNEYVHQLLGVSGNKETHAQEDVSSERGAF